MSAMPADIAAAINHLSRVSAVYGQARATDKPSVAKAYDTARAALDAAILAQLQAPDIYPAGEPTTDLDHANYDRDAWMERALRAQTALSAALARAERMEKALLLIVNGRCGACKRPNGANGCTLSDGEGGAGCGYGKLCFYETVDADEVARAALAAAPAEEG